MLNFAEVHEEINAFLIPEEKLLNNHNAKYRHCQFRLHHINQAWNGGISPSLLPTQAEVDVRSEEVVIPSSSLLTSLFLP